MKNLTRLAGWTPCIGQIEEFDHKRCTMLPTDDRIVSEAIETIASAYDVDTRLLADGLPVIRYIPGGGPVGVHGDIGKDGRVPNATIVVYLTDDDHDHGATFFPNIGLRVEPRRGSSLSFTSIGADGHPDDRAKHGVSRLSQRSRDDRLVLQIPVRSSASGWEAYPEHVSGMKHRAHMGIMLLVTLGVGGYYVYDMLYGSHAIDAVGHAALRKIHQTVVVGASSIGSDGRL